MKKGMKTHTLTVDEMPSYDHEIIKEKWEETFEEKVKTSYARGGFLTADYDNSWVIDTESIKDFIRHAISEAVEEEWERIAYHLKYIDWTNSQTGIAIGTKKAVIEEALSIINEKGFPSSVNH